MRMTQALRAPQRLPLLQVVKSALATIVAWLKLPAEQFFVDEDGGAESEAAQPDLMAQLVPLLRARKDLSETDMDYLQKVFAATVEHVRSKER